MPTKAKLTLRILLVLALLPASWYIYLSYFSKPSMVVLYSPTATAKQVRRDVSFLKKRGYHFVSAARIRTSLYSESTLKEPGALIALQKEPSEELAEFLEANRIPAIVFLSPEELPNRPKSENLEFGLKPSSSTQSLERPTSGFISINFDDGWKSVYENAFPVLKKAKMPASIYVVAETIIDDNPKYVTEQQLRTLQDDGWEIGSHSFGHDNFNEISDIERAYSMTVSRGFLEAKGLYANGFAFPYGEYDSSDLLQAQRYYSYVRILGNGLSHPGNRRVVRGYSLRKNTSIRRIEKMIKRAKEGNANLVLVFHHINEESTEYAITPDNFEKIVRLIKSSGMPVQTSLPQKPWFLRQEAREGIEGEQLYTERLRKTFEDQRAQLEKKGFKTSYFLYPEGVITRGMREAAEQAGFHMGLSGRRGFVWKSSDPLDVTTIGLRKSSLESALLE